MIYKFIRYLIILNLITFFNLISVKANEKIVYLDTKYILNESIAGKSIIKKLNATQNKNIEILKKIEGKLKENEKKLISSKNVVDKDEFKKKAIKLKQEVVLYQDTLKKKKKALQKEKFELNRKFINKLTPILTDYSKENSISMILDKNNILIGQSSLDITKDIIDILNKKVKKIQ
jgi:outer membrane protein